MIPARVFPFPTWSGTVVAILWVWLVASPTLESQSKRAKKPVLKGGTEVVLPVEVEGADGMDFHLHLPRGWKSRTRKTYPALLALHGNGQAAASNFRTCCQLSQKKTPLIVIAPAYQKEKRFNAPCWPQDVCMKAFDWLRQQAVSEWHADPEQFFVQGFSMGGSYASLYVLHEQARRKEGQPLPIRGAILNSGGGAELASDLATGRAFALHRGGAGDRGAGKGECGSGYAPGGELLLSPGRGRAFPSDPGHEAHRESRVSGAGQAAPLRGMRAGQVGRKGDRLVQESDQEGTVSGLSPETDRAAGEVVATGAPPRSARTGAWRRCNDLPVMVAELEAWKQWEAAFEADRSGQAAKSRPLFEALVKAHPRTEAGRRAQDRLTWLEGRD